METAFATSPGWEPIGATSNTQYYLAPGNPDVVIVVPDPSSSDDASTARANVGFQMGYAESLGRPCAFVVLLGRLRSQDAGARREYAEGMDPKRRYASALVVTGALSRAIGSFFLGITRPLTPTRLFESTEAAIAWSIAQRPRLG